MAKKRASPSKSESIKDGDHGVDFEAALAEVEQIVARLEGGQLGLTESLQQYEAGIHQLKRCQALLDAAQQRVSLLSGVDADGNPLTEPLPDLPAETDEHSAEPRQGRRTRPGPRDATTDTTGVGQRPDSVDDPPGLF